MSIKNRTGWVWIVKVKHPTGFLSIDRDFPCKQEAVQYIRNEKDDNKQAGTKGYKYRIQKVTWEK